MRLLTSKLINYVLITTNKLGIDESHGLMHSMNTLNYAKKIYESELPNNPRLINDQKIIYASSLLHDMADKKYINEKEGIMNIENFLKKETKMDNEEIEITKNIITTMSYSTVKKQGYPSLGKFQQSYHIVREADLLCGYDFNRAMIYDITQNNSTTEEAFDNSYKLFIKRVLQYSNDNLFIHKYSKKEAYLLHAEAIKQIEVWRNIMVDK
jgi:HD superfamily phosphodiesterase